MEKTAITRKEFAKCKGVVAAFDGQFEDQNLIILKDKKYGYIVLNGFDPEHKKTEEALTFQTAEEMFEKLWDCWYRAQIQDYAEKKGLPGYEEALEDMPQEMKDSFEERKEELKKVADTFAKINDLQFNKNLHKYSSFAILAGSIANLYAAVKKNRLLSIVTAVITGVSAVLCILSGHRIAAEEPSGDAPESEPETCG